MNPYKITKQLFCCVLIFAVMSACSNDTWTPTQTAKPTNQYSPTVTDSQQFTSTPTFTSPLLPTLTPTKEHNINYTTSGLITKDEIWRNEIHLTGDIVLDDNITLTIEPGTKVYLASNSDDQKRGWAWADDYVLEHKDPVGSLEWVTNTIEIDGQLGSIYAVGTAEQPIIFQPEGNNTSPAQWDGIKFVRGALKHAIVLYGGTTAVQIMDSAESIEVAYNEVRYFHWAGIDVHAKNAWIHHNIVEGGGHHGIGARFNSIVEHNTVINSIAGIAIENGDNTVVRNNIVIDSANGISLRSATTAEITNNTIAYVKGPPEGWFYQGKLIYPRTEEVGIRIKPVGQVKILNNIIFNTGGGIWLTQNAELSADSRVDHNLVWGVSDGILGKPSSLFGEGNISIDPLFFDIDNNDFHLLAGSPAIDTGDPAILDPDGSISDMGAFGGTESDKW